MPARPKRIAGDIELKLKGGKLLRFSDVRELYLQRDAWKGIKPERMRARLERMRRTFETVHDALQLVDRGESAARVARSLGYYSDRVNKWRAGKSLPKIISPKEFGAQMAKRGKFLTETALANPRLAYLLGIRMGSPAINRNSPAFFRSPANAGLLTIMFRVVRYTEKATEA